MKQLIPERVVQRAGEVLEIEAAAVRDLSGSLGPEFVKAFSICLNCEGRIVVTGMGKSGHIAGKIAATLASTGSPAFFVHPGEASHGDLGMITPADVVLASGRYVRDKTVGGSAQSIVPEGDDASVQDLIDWRRDVGLPPRPALGIVTSKAGFDPQVAASLADDVIAVLGEEPDAETRSTLEDHGLSVVAAGRNGRVTGDLLVEALGGLGHKVVFSAAGPQVFHTLTPVADALHLTLAGRLLGGRSYSTLLEGDELEVPPSFDLATAYLDPEGPGGAVQLFLEFTRDRE